MVSKKEFDKLSFIEKFKLLTRGDVELTPEQQAEADEIKAQVEAQGGQTGEAAPVTGEDVADVATSFGGGGVFKQATTGVRVGSKAAGIAAKEASKKVTTNAKVLNKVDVAVEKYMKKYVADVSKKYKTAGDLIVTIGSKGGVGVTSRFKVNVKNLSTMGKIANVLWGSKTRKMMSVAGVSAGSVLLSLWARAEAIEGAGFTVMKPALDRGIFTGDWSIYNEAKGARDNIINQNKLQQINNFLPISGAVQNIGNKVSAIIKNYEFMDKLAEAGESDLAEQENVIGNAEEFEVAKLQLEKEETELGLDDVRKEEIRREQFAKIGVDSETGGQAAHGLGEGARKKKLLEQKLKKSKKEYQQ